ncbi:MAG: hypothetical protein AAGG48_13160 [Planctomycetota bacterium]
MATDKTPTLIVVVIIAARQQWFVAGVSLADAKLDCFVKSEPANLDDYVGKSPDEQLSFLRHRLSGAMQRGFDRLWAKHRKAHRIVLIADEDLPDSAAGLLPNLANHLDTWMTRPPISFFRGEGHGQFDELDQLSCLVGPLNTEEAASLQEQLPALKAALEADASWEVIAKPRES